MCSRIQQNDHYPQVVILFFFILMHDSSTGWNNETKAIRPTNKCVANILIKDTFIVNKSPFFLTIHTFFSLLSGLYYYQQQKLSFPQIEDKSEELLLNHLCLAELVVMLFRIRLGGYNQVLLSGKFRSHFIQALHRET